MVRAQVPDEWVERVGAVLDALPETRREKAWTGVRWVVRGANVAHLFGGEDQLIRLTFRAPMDEVAAFEHLGDPYFSVGWGGDVVGLVLGTLFRFWSYRTFVFPALPDDPEDRELAERDATTPI